VSGNSSRSSGTPFIFLFLGFFNHHQTDIFEFATLCNADFLYQSNYLRIKRLKRKRNKRLEKQIPKQPVPAIAFSH